MRKIIKKWKGRRSVKKKHCQTKISALQKIQKTNDLRVCVLERITEATWLFGRLYAPEKTKKKPKERQDWLHKTRVLGDTFVFTARPSSIYRFGKTGRLSTQTKRTAQRATQS